MSKKPKCIIVTGRPGSGKTTLSRLLGERLWMPVISRDAIKEGYVNTFGLRHDRLPPDTNGVVSNLFFEIVSHHLAGMVSVVVEAAFQHKVWEPQIPLVSQVGDPVIVVCSVDPGIAAKRHLERGLDDPNREYYHGDKRVSIYRETGVLSPPGEYIAPEFDVPTIHVSTQEGYSPSIEEIVAKIRSLLAQQSCVRGPQNTCVE